MYKKIDNTNKTESMVGYLDNGTVVAVESGWRIKPETLAKLLMDRFRTTRQPLSTKIMK